MKKNLKKDFVKTYFILNKKIVYANKFRIGLSIYKNKKPEIDNAITI